MRANLNFADRPNHPHINLLENFDPNYTPDPFRWIPKGLMEDLMDNTPNEIIVNDLVSGYSISQIFGALQSNVASISDYKSKLIQLYGTAQQNQLNNLFVSYHY